MSFRREPLGLKQPSVAKARRKAIRRVSKLSLIHLSEPTKPD